MRMGDAPTPSGDRRQMGDSITPAHQRVEEDPNLRRRARCLLIGSAAMVIFQVFTALRIGQDGGVLPCDETVRHPHEAIRGEALDSDTCGMTGTMRGGAANSSCVHRVETMTMSDCVAMVFATLVIAVTVTEEIKAARGAYEAAPAYLESPRRNQLAG